MTNSPGVGVDGEMNQTEVGMRIERTVLGINTESGVTVMKKMDCCPA
jgi:hypothetical protein